MTDPLASLIPQNDFNAAGPSDLACLEGRTLLEDIQETVDARIATSFRKFEARLLALEVAQGNAANNARRFEDGQGGKELSSEGNHEGGAVTLRACMPAEQPQGACSSDPSPRRGYEEDSANQWQWTIKESAWDAAMLIGHSQIRFGGSMMIVAMLCINIAMQLAFITVIEGSLTDISFPEDERDGFRMFRTTIAHHIDNLDLLTERTLASRVCDGDSSLHLGNRQSEAVSLIDDYMKGGGGRLMCLMASLAWIFTVCKELHAIVEQCCATLALQRCSVSEIEPDAEFFSRRLGKTHVCALATIATLRVGIACTLLLFGLKFLAYTISVPELMFNAVALEFVLNLDEIIYAALAPLCLRMFTDRQLCLRKRGVRGWQWAGADFQSLMSFACGVVALSLTASMLLEPQIENMSLAGKELCDGRKDFAYGSYSVGVVGWSDTKEFDADAFRKSNGHTLIRQLIETKPADYHKTKPWSLLGFKARAGAAGNYFSLYQQVKWPETEMADVYNNGCYDIGAKAQLFDDWWLSTLRDTLSDQTVSKCSQVAAYCQQDSSQGNRVRQACSETCGCHSPASDLILPGPQAGCPTLCKNSEQRQDDLETRNCSDVPLEGLHAYIQDIVAVVRTWSTMADVQNLMNVTLGLLDRFGCSARTQIVEEFGQSADFCFAERWPTGLKSLTFYCPVSCECAERPQNMPGDCPRRCKATIP